ncbi:TPA: LytTR family response regulator CdtR [Clostridioides difficile]|nr:LytTR family response regulator CdtR [Clostridioides difficile]HBG4216814.1 LytTR family response regulator CdtR [Clostridioides difficile]
MDILIFDNDVCFGMKLKEKINNILIKEGFDNDVVRLYHNSNLLLKELTEKNKVRIYFIVVDAKYKISNELCDGLWIAQKIRESDYISPIIFLTNHIEMILGIFDYRLEVMDFILKHDMEIAESKIKACIKIAHKRYIKEKNYRSNFFTIYSDFSLWKISFDEVIYFETSTIPHKIKLVTTSRIFEFYKSLKSLPDLDACFIRVHKSFVVNKYHIVSLDLKKNNIKMSNGHICRISNTYRNILKNIIKT